MAKKKVVRGARKPRTLSKKQRGGSVTAPTRIGQGYSLFTGDGLNTAISGNSEDSAGRLNLSWTLCDSSEQFLGVLGIEASAAAGFSRIASVDAKLEMMYSLQLTTHSVSLVVYSKHTTGTTSFYDTRLKDKAPANDTELKNFFRYYGDTYVSEIVKGGEYFAVYVFYAESKDEQLEVKASLRASGVIEGVPVSGSLQATVGLAMKTSTTRVKFDQVVLGVKNPPELPMPDQAIDFANKFGKLNKDAPVILGIKVRGYEHVVGMGGNFDKIANNRTILLQLVELQGKVQRLINQIDGIRAIYDFYGGFSDKKLVDVRALAEQDIGTLDGFVDSYLENPTQDFSAAARFRPASLNNGIPTVNHTTNTVTVGPSGGNGPAKDVNPESAVEQMLAVRRLEFTNKDNMLRKMKITYENADTGKATVEVGGSGGSSKSRDFANKEVITSIMGITNGKGVVSLLVATNKGTLKSTTSGSGTPFEHSVPAGAFAVTLQARSDGNVLRSLSLTWAEFKPALWLPSV